MAHEVSFNVAKAVSSCTLDRGSRRVLTRLYCCRRRRSWHDDSHGLLFARSLSQSAERGSAACFFAAAPYDYVTSVVAAGGIPFLVPPLTAASAGLVLAPAAGLLLTGGGDVAPFRYGEETDPARGEVDEERDNELAVVRQAGAMGIPILAVCRGAQLLNVALGGTLKQHICDERARSPPMARTPIRGGASLSTSKPPPFSPPPSWRDT